MKEGQVSRIFQGFSPSPLERSFLKRWVPISCCSGALEKIIWVISSEITPPCGHKQNLSTLEFLSQTFNTTTDSLIFLFLPRVGPSCLPGTPGSHCQPFHHPQGHHRLPLWQRSSSWRAAKVITHCLYFPWQCSKGHYFPSFHSESLCSTMTCLACLYCLL